MPAVLVVPVAIVILWSLGCVLVLVVDGSDPENVGKLWAIGLGLAWSVLALEIVAHFIIKWW